MKRFWFTFLWFWKFRDWAPTRQKYKRFDKDLNAYLERGVKPW